MPQMERVRSAAKVRAQVFERIPPPTADAEFRAGVREELAQAERAGRRAPSPHDHPVIRYQEAQRKERGLDGGQLRDVQQELQALRGEIAQLTQALGSSARRPGRRTSTGVLQQRDQLDSDVRHEQFLAEDAQQQARLKAQMRRSEVARIEERQQALLGVLRRAERRLQQAPKNLPPGLRDSLIGEIYRARYNIALFGGTQTVILSGGMMFDRAV